MHVRDRAIDIGAQHQPVGHCDALMPRDAHAIADFSALERIGWCVHFIAPVSNLNSLSAKDAKHARGKLRINTDCFRNASAMQ
jgi:hypothetical protein